MDVKNNLSYSSDKNKNITILPEDQVAYHLLRDDDYFLRQRFVYQ